MVWLMVFVLTLFAALPASAQSADHIERVKKAQRAAYAISDATDGCPSVTADLFGWPADRVMKCTYAEGPPANRLQAVVYLLKVEPETIARWIETGCSGLQAADPESCFRTVLKCGKLNSGMMFPVSGNMLEDMTPSPWQNFFFRNGMTVRMQGQKNGTSDQIPLDRQDELSLAPDTEIESIPSGLTRFWRTRPKQFAAHYPTAGAPSSVGSSADRQTWLDMARKEFLTALSSPTNRLLEAWVAAHPKTLSAAKCPKDGDP
jgi:hypothetical protein